MTLDHLNRFLKSNLLDLGLITVCLTGLAAVVTGHTPSAYAQALRVDVPVPVYCDETLPTVPQLPAHVLFPGADPAVATAALIAHVEALEGALEDMQGVLKACTAPVAAATP